VESAVGKENAAYVGGNVKRFVLKAMLIIGVVIYEKRNGYLIARSLISLLKKLNEQACLFTIK